MEVMHEPLDVARLTAGQPFCAGVVIVEDGRLLVTLNTDWLPAELDGTAWRVGGVGGGQEPGETISECALREAREELCAEVARIPADTTYYHDLDTGELAPVRCVDLVPPLLFQRRRNAQPEVPFRPGLPAGPYTYLALYLATLPNPAVIQPGDDVEGLLYVPLTEWDLLTTMPTLQDALRCGARLIERQPLDRGRRLYLRDDESATVVASLLRQR
ncbi:MAG TPA: NUDIX domain-containing protein [Ktedonobacterales bacterium]